MSDDRRSGDFTLIYWSFRPPFRTDEETTEEICKGGSGNRVRPEEGIIEKNIVDHMADHDLVYVTWT